MADDGTCEACRYWQPAGSDQALPHGEVGNSGECRRHAPVRVLAECPRLLTFYAHTPASDEGSESEDARRVFPLTFAWDWCGEYRGTEEARP